MVLVIDDTADIREEIGEHLTSGGYAPLLFADGASALALLEEGAAPNVILLDLMMPGMNGFEFRRLQLADPRLARIPTVLMTAIQSLERNELRMEHVLLKPFRAPELFAALERALRPSK